MSVISASDNWADNEIVDLAAVAGKLWKHRWWIAASALICTALATLYAFTATPIYRASVLMVPANNNAGGGLEGALGQLSGLASLAGVQIGNANLAKAEALAVLQSRELTEAFIRDKNLMPLLFPKRWDQELQRWRADKKQPTPAEANKYFGEKVRSVYDDKKTNLVTLRIDWNDRVEAAAWANELVERLNAEMRARAIAAAEASIGYLEDELPSTETVATREAINRLIEAQIKQRMLANVTREYVFRVVDKAMAPDEDDPIRPRKVMLIAGAFLGGIALSTGFILVMGFAGGQRGNRRERAENVSVSG